jgi:prepilin-type processing-associated H-X9-DG protein
VSLSIYPRTGHNRPIANRVFETNAAFCDGHCLRLAPAQAYRIEATTDLSAPKWTDIGTVTNVSNGVIFVDPSTHTFPAILPGGAYGSFLKEHVNASPVEYLGHVMSKERLLNTVFGDGHVEGR